MEYWIINGTGILAELITLNASPFLAASQSEKR